MGILFIPQAPHITPGAVVAQKQSAVQHHTRPESGAEGDTQQVSVSADAPRPGQTFIQLRQSSGKRLTVGKQISVVVDKNRNTKHLFQVGTQCHTSSEGGEIR